MRGALDKALNLPKYLEKIYKEEPEAQADMLRMIDFRAMIKAM